MPYVSTLNNYRSTAIHIAELLIVLVANYYRTMLSNTDINIKSHRHNAALLVYVSLMACTIFSLIVTVFDTLRKMGINLKKGTHKSKNFLANETAYL